MLDGIFTERKPELFYFKSKCKDATQIKDDWPLSEVAVKQFHSL